MRPQRFSCGIHYRTPHEYVGTLSFNEAAAFQLRNRAAATPLTPNRCCFNEAAAFQLRNLPPKGTLDLEAVLQ